MSKVTIIISHTAINEIESNRYFKHDLIHQNPFIYVRMRNGVLADGLINGEFLALLKNLNQTVYFAVGELCNHQGELDFALALWRVTVFNDCPMLNDNLDILENQFYRI